MAAEDGFRRIVGNDANGAIYFLPWRTSFQTALDFGLVGLRRWRLCYELPAAVVAADPEACARANRSVIEDAADQIERRRPRVLVGLSMGSVPATLLAGRYNTALWSFASADRGDLMIWQSPAARRVRRQAEALGVTLGDFTRALRGLNPIEWLDRIDPASRFSVGSFDRYVPRARRRALVKRAAATVPIEHVVFEPLGHLGVMALSQWRQNQWLRQA
ncbi:MULTISPECIES: alpha/beta fold hydrolase [Rhodopseudomonas]|uniref:alpha/beta fold hydrolase n=1 Tax=Rhodopseudomonas TaxID=1073 RepID=UPI001F41FD8A|nr:MULTISPECIES: hypothetical protein [Rhodopseudomonas]